MNTNPNAKIIVCYGDSNTWGDVPNKDERYLANVRWVGVLQDVLGNEYEVVNEGLCGRTLVAKDPQKPHRTGITHLKSILSTNDPVDVITVMLGTNDMKGIYDLSAEEISKDLRQTVRFIQKEAVNGSGESPQILIICPPPVVNPIDVELSKNLEDAPNKSQLLPPLYENVAQELRCLFLDAGEYINLENTDGYHLNSEHHKILGEKIASIIQGLEG